MHAPFCFRGCKDAEILIRRQGWGLWSAYRSPPAAQTVEQDGREHGVAILVAFALFDTQHAAPTVDIDDFE